MTQAPAQQQHLEELADRLTKESGVRQALFLTDDGLRAGGSRSLSLDAQDKAAATANGLLFTARSAALSISENDAGGPAEAPRVAQVIAETDQGFLIVMGAGEHTILAAWTTPEADIGVVAYKMMELTAKLGQSMEAPAREPGT